MKKWLRPGKHPGNLPFDDEEEVEVSLAEWQLELETQAIHVLDGVVARLPQEALVSVKLDGSDKEQESSEGSVSEGESETTHSAGSAVETDSSTSSEEEDHEVLTGDLGLPTEPLGKGQRRRLLDAVHRIGEAAHQGVQEKKARETGLNRRLPGPWRMVEIFTWTCMMTQCAYQRGWDTYEPVTLESGWDLTNKQVQDEAFRYLERIDPDFIMIAWPCAPWSIMQNANMRTPTQIRILKLKRLRSRRTFLQFARRVALWQRHRGRAVAAENPGTSGAWKTPEIQEGCGGLEMALFDQCRMGLKHPTTDQPMKKFTAVAGQSEVVKYLQGVRCDGKHEHAPIEGSYKGKDGKWASLSDFAGGYPAELCQRLLQGAEEYLQGGGVQGTYMEDEMDFEDEGAEVPEPIAGEDAIEEEEQLADQSEGEFPERADVRDQPLEEDERRPVAKEIRRAVEFTHRQLGHPSRSTLIRMMRISGANPEAIRYARRWTCPVCASKQKPRHPQAATATARPYGFNHHIHIDLKFVHDIREKRYAVLSMICLGTVKHHCVLIKTRRSDYVAQKFFRHWVMLYGAPGRVTHDQGGEFEQSFVAMLEQMAIPSTVTGAHAPWQLAIGERHGEILGVMIQAVVEEHSVEGYRAMKTALAAAVMAKNATVTREGYTPNQRVFGVEQRWPSLTDEDVGPSFAEAVNTDSEVARAHRMRTSARIALLRQDVREKMRRAILRKPATSVGPYPAGAQVYFWVPGKGRRYSQTKGSIWRGPATILTKEQQKRYFISWRGRLLLVAEENLRLATREELSLSEPVREEVLDLQGVLREQGRIKSYQDLRDVPPPPRKRRKRIPTEGDKKAALDSPERKKAKLMMRGTKSVRSLLGPQKRPAGALVYYYRRRVRRKREQAPQVEPERPAEPAAAEEAEDVPREEQEPEQYTPSIAPADEDHQEDLQEEREEESADEVEPTSPADPDSPAEEQAAPEPVRPEDIPIIDEWDEMDRVEEMQNEWENLPSAERRQRLNDDVPRALKRKFIERGEEGDPGLTEEKRRRISQGLVTQTALGAIEPGPDNEWVTRYELTLLRQLTGLPVTAARLHRAPRKRFMRPPKLVSRSRLTVMIGKDPVDSFIVRETTEEVKQNPRRKASFPWRGMTMFIRGEVPEDPKEQKLYPTYLRNHHGLYQVDLSYEQRTAFEEAWAEQLKDTLRSEVMVLKLKQSGKELDPKAFEGPEWEKFNEADAREWEQWVDNGVMKRIPKEKEHLVPKFKIFRSPLRMVRTNRSGGLLQVQAGSAGTSGPWIGAVSNRCPNHLSSGHEIGKSHGSGPRLGRLVVRRNDSVLVGRQYRS